MLNDENRILLGQRVKELRQGRGLSAAQVAAQALGYGNGSHVAVTRLERAQLVVLRKDHLLRLVEFFGVEPEYLLVHLLADVAEEQAPHPSTARSVKKSACDTPGQRIRHLRMLRELDCSDFAENLRRNGPVVLASDVQSWEEDERAPNPVQLSALCRFAGCTEDWLLHGASELAAA